MNARAPKKFERARSDQAKQVRREAILESARALFQDQSYDAITVEAVARASRLAKGTVYLYFATKEAIFLELLLVELERWFAALAAPFEALARGDAATVADVLASSLARRPALRRLLALLHVTLERNVDRDAARSFKLRAAAAMAPTAARLEQRLPRFRPGDGVRFLLHLHALAVGVGQVSDVSDVIDDVLDEPALAPFRVEFVGELRELLELVLAGWGDDTLRARRPTGRRA